MPSKQQPLHAHQSTHGIALAMLLLCIIMMHSVATSNNKLRSDHNCSWLAPRLTTKWWQIVSILLTSRWSREAKSGMAPLLSQNGPNVAFLNLPHTHLALGRYCKELLSHHKATQPNEQAHLQQIYEERLKNLHYVAVPTFASHFAHLDTSDAPGAYPYRSVFGKDTPCVLSDGYMFFKEHVGVVVESTCARK